MNNHITSAPTVKQYQLANIATGDNLTMNSREIAELCNKDHKNVIADVRNMLEQLNLRSAEFSADLPDSYGRKQLAFILPKDLTLTLVSGYNVQMRKRIIDRWLELEGNTQAQVNPAQLSRLQLIEMAMQAEQERLLLEHRVGELLPKADALDRFATFTDGSFCLRDAAKTLQIQEKRFIQALHERSWIYRRPMGTGWLAYSEKLQSGLMEHKITTGQKGDGSEWASTQPRITAKGLAKLSEILSTEEAES
ncbi:phage antirepressor KilAC domain-containing protein [Undibacterium sp.]|uniref:phage antirepressor KilAC domain-containing protein n=1 Tax=Undibacterium sp. TaxID=1914977 RepID=UPI0037536BE8